jgi:alpha-L-fucosidase 2
MNRHTRFFNPEQSMPVGRRSNLILTPIVGVLCILSGIASGQSDPTQVLQYDRPAEQWTEALPVGNGRLGCMVFGGVDEARYQFNEDSLWSGKPHDYAHPGASEHLNEIRSLLFAGKRHEAEQLAQRVFMSVPLHQCAYQPFGDVVIDFHNRERATDYRRSLDLRTGTATTEYKVGDTTYTRQTIASYPDQVVAIHLKSSRPGQLTFDARLTSPHPGTKVVADAPATLVMTGRITDSHTREGDHFEGAMRFAARLRVTSPDGSLRATDDGLSETIRIMALVKSV